MYNRQLKHHIHLVHRKSLKIAVFKTPDFTLWVMFHQALVLLIIGLYTH